VTCRRSFPSTPTVHTSPRPFASFETIAKREPSGDHASPLANESFGSSFETSN
jgi:hypothetical protein